MLFRSGDLMRIDEMPAGREMDKAIGQYIFKYWVDHYDKDCAENCYYCLIDGSGDAVIPGFYGERKSEEEAWADCPEFSTDIAAAWEVVEKMGNYLFACGRNDEGMWEACFFPVNSGIGKLNEAHGDTAPLAISRAALKALGVTEI